MKGFIALKAFKHTKHYKIGDKVDISDYVNKQLELKGLIKWVERPLIIMPKKHTKIKKDARKSKKNIWRWPRINEARR